MKVYFYSKPEPEKESQAENHLKIFEFFRENGVDVVSNLRKRPDDDELSFEKMEGLVVEGSKSAPEAGYLVATALSQEKPVLYLLPKGSLIPDQLRLLMNNKKFKKIFLLDFYGRKTLNNFLIDFIDIIETGELRRQVPTIKFTLRFTPRADRYMTWLSRKKNISKADLLRKMIDEDIKDDEEYQGHLRRPRNEE
jgi:hypothetical protein